MGGVKIVPVSMKMLIFKNTNTAFILNEYLIHYMLIVSVYKHVN